MTDFVDKAEAWDMLAVKNKEITRLKTQLFEMTRLATSFLCSEIDYMTVNKLGDPEKQHNVKWARELGITVFMPRECVPSSSKLVQDGTQAEHDG